MQIDLYQVNFNSRDEDFVSTIKISSIPRIGEQIELLTEDRTGCSLQGFPTCKMRNFIVEKVVYRVNQAPLSTNHTLGNRVALIARYLVSQ